MATTLRRQLLDLIAILEPGLESAFLEAIEGIKSEIVIAELIEALERRDIEAAVAALHIEPSAFRPLSEAMRSAFNQGGMLVVKGIPAVTDIFGQRAVIRWDGNNQRAEQIIREQAASSIEFISENTRKMLRETIATGFAQGQGPRTIARAIAGRESKITRKLEGGLLGMTAEQADYVREARAILSDPSRIKEYLTKDRATGKWKAKYSKTDKRYIASIAKAIREGRALDADKIETVIDRLTKSYVRLRAENVALFETGEAVGNSQHEAYQQMLDRTGRDPNLVERDWRTASDGRVRHSHVELHGQKMTGMDEPFVTILGNRMRFPMDSRFGATSADKQRCRCICLYSFNFAESYSRSRGR